MGVAECSYKNLNNTDDLLWITKSGVNSKDVCFVCMWELCRHQFNEIDQLSVHLNEHLINYTNNIHNLSKIIFFSYFL